MPNSKIKREEELKNKIGGDFFSDFGYTHILGNIDFCVQAIREPGFFGEISLLWAEAKSGSKDVFLMFAQLILTIGKAKTYTKHMPPAFLGVFDSEKMAFVPYEKIRHLFLQNDFNWNVAPSNTATKEFAQIKELVADILESEQYLFHYKTHDRELRSFIKNNIAKGTDKNRIQIDKNNFTWIFEDWMECIKPLIDYPFDKDKQRILDLNFFLADLFVDDKRQSEIRELLEKLQTSADKNCTKLYFRQTRFAHTARFQRTQRGIFHAQTMGAFVATIYSGLFGRRLAR